MKENNEGFNKKTKKKSIKKLAIKRMRTKIR